MSGLLALFAWFTIFGLFAICLQTKEGTLYPKIHPWLDSAES